MNPNYHNMFNESSSGTPRVMPLEPSPNMGANSSLETNCDINSRGFLPTLGDLQSVGWNDYRPISSASPKMREHGVCHRPSSPHGMQFHSNLIPSQFPSPLSSALDSYHNPSARIGNGCSLQHHSQFHNHPGRAPPTVSNGPKFAYGRSGEGNSIDGRLKSNVPAAKVAPVRIAPKRTVPIAPKPPMSSNHVSSEPHSSTTTSQRAVTPPSLTDVSPDPDVSSPFDGSPGLTSPNSTRPAGTKRASRKGGNGNLPKPETTNVLRNFLTSEHRSKHKRAIKPVNSTEGAISKQSPIAEKQDPKAAPQTSIKFLSTGDGDQEMGGEFDVDGGYDDSECNGEFQMSQNLSIVREHNELLVYQNESKRKYAFMRQTNDRTSNSYRPTGVTREQAMAAMDKALLDDNVFSFTSYCRIYADHRSQYANSMSNLTSTYPNSSSWEDCFSSMYLSPPSVVYKEMDSHQISPANCTNEQPLPQTQSSYRHSSAQIIHGHPQHSEEEITPVYLPNLSRILFMNNLTYKEKSSTDPLRHTRCTGGIKKHKRSHGSAKF